MAEARKGVNAGAMTVEIRAQPADATLSTIVRRGGLYPEASHASFQQINYLMVYHILHSFFAQPEPVYRG